MKKILSQITVFGFAAGLLALFFFILTPVAGGTARGLEPQSIDQGVQAPSFPDRRQVMTGTVRFASIGDYGEDTPEQADVAALIDTWNVDFIITQGDNRYGARTYDQTNGKYYCDMLRDILSGTHCAGGTAGLNAFFPATGNHDYNDGLGAGINEYLDYFTLPGAGIPTSGTSGSELYYDFVRGPVHFFVIDSQGALLNSANMAGQQAWLASQISASTAPWQIVTLHHAPYSSSSNHGSNANMQWDFAAWGADAVLAGHDHTYERIERGGILYFVNGLGGRSLYGLGTPIAGSQVRYNADYGAMLIEAGETFITFEFYSRAGLMIDSYTLLPPVNRSTYVRVAAGPDDVEEDISDGSIYIDSSDLELGSTEEPDPGPQLVGLRFTGVEVPAEAEIVSAYITFEVDETEVVSAALEIWGQASPDAQAFSAVPYDVSSRLTTTAHVAWPDIPVWSVVSEQHQTPDLSAIVEEILAEPAWSPGSAMVFLFGGTGTRTAEAFEGEPQNDPQLYIEYSLDPAPVLDLTAVISGSDLLLDWSPVETDVAGGPIFVDHYEVHRSTDPYFIPAPGTLVSTIVSAGFTDPGVAGGPGYFYAVLVVDWAARLSAASNRVGNIAFYLVPD